MYSVPKSIFLAILIKSPSEIPPYHSRRSVQESDVRKCDQYSGTKIGTNSFIRTYHIRIGGARVKEGNVRRVLVDNRTHSVAQLLTNQPTVIGSKTGDVSTVAIHNLFKIKLLLEGHTTL